MPLTEAQSSPSRPYCYPLTALTLCLVLLCRGFAHAQSQPPPVPTPPIAPGRPDLPPLPAPPTNHLTVEPAFLVVVDAAHGGPNTGARIAPITIEKDITFALSIRLRAALAAREITVVMTRESDIDPPPNQRAGIANHALASACLVLHATATGTGVHLFTSSLAPIPASAGQSAPNLVPWQNAQATWVTRSLRLSSEINSALGQRGIPATFGIASVEPLDNLSCPAVAIEVAPLAASTANPAFPISDDKYQQRIIDALAAAILEWRTDWKQQP